MTAPTQTMELDTKLVLFSRDGKTVYVVPGEPPTLPTVRPPESDQPAKAFTMAIRSSFGVDSFLLTSIDDIPTQQDVPSYKALVLAGAPATSSGLVEVPNRSPEFQNLPEGIRSVIEHALNLCSRPDPEFPFSYLGWTDGLLNWLEAQVDSLGFGKIEECRHVKGRGRSIILVIQTKHGPLWFKVPPQNCPEFEVTQLLSQCCTAWLPRVYSFNSEWRGWLMEHVGVSLHEVPAVKHPHEQIVHGLAEIQIKASPLTNRLLAMGCQDCSLPSLQAKIDPLIHLLQIGLDEQPVQHPRRLRVEDLDRLQHYLHVACVYLGKFDIPNSILHGDLGKGSLLFDGNRVAFTDWERAHIGLPLFDFQIHCDYTKAHHAENTAKVLSLRERYLLAIEKGLGAKGLIEAYRVVPALTMLTHLCACWNWIDPSVRRDRWLGGNYVRSVARRILHEIEQPEFLEAACRK
jgi:Phosphotransferase enzyme family